MWQGSLKGSLTQIEGSGDQKSHAATAGLWVQRLMPTSLTLACTVTSARTRLALDLSTWTTFTLLPPGLGKTAGHAVYVSAVLAPTAYGNTHGTALICDVQCKNDIMMAMLHLRHPYLLCRRPVA